jgi:hypothetical protein
VDDAVAQLKAGDVAPHTGEPNHLDLCASPAPPPGGGVASRRKDWSALAQVAGYAPHEAAGYRTPSTVSIDDRGATLAQVAETGCRRLTWPTT